jgi:hypothetical protein
MSDQSPARCWRSSPVNCEQIRQVIHTMPAPKGTQIYNSHGIYVLEKSPLRRFTVRKAAPVICGRSIPRNELRVVGLISFSVSLTRASYLDVGIEPIQEEGIHAD